MNFETRRSKHLSTIRTARSLSGLFIVFGFLMLIVSAAIGTLLIQSNLGGTDVSTALESLARDQAVAESRASPTEESAPSGSTANLRTLLQIWIAKLQWDHLWRLLGASLLILWLGYVLRILSILAETQFMDYQPAA